MQPSLGDSYSVSRPSLIFLRSDFLLRIGCRIKHLTQPDVILDPQGIHCINPYMAFAATEVDAIHISIHKMLW